jgi:RNA-binding protein YhbY
MQKRKDKFNKKERLTELNSETSELSSVLPDFDKPSRFVVNLKEQEAISGKRGTEQGGFDLDNFYDWLSELDFKKYFTGIKKIVASWTLRSASNLAGNAKKIFSRRKPKVNINKKKVKQAVSRIIEDSRSVAVYEDNKLTIKSLFLFWSGWRGFKDWYLIYGQKLPGLTVFSLFKFIMIIIRKIVRAVYRICFRVGWLFVFGVRFIYFSVLAIGKSLKNGVELLKDYLAAFCRVLVLILKRFIMSGQSKFQRATGGFAKIIFQRLLVKRCQKTDCEMDVDGQNSPISYATKNSYSVGGGKINEKPKDILAPPQFSILGLKRVFTFALVLLILILPFKAFTYYKKLDLDELKGRVLGASEEAVNSLFSAGQFASEMDFKGAQESFKQAADKFFAAQNELKSISATLLKLASIAPNEDLRFASESKNILEAGQEAAELGSNLSLAIGSFLKENRSAGSIGEALGDFILYGSKAAVNANNLDQSLSKINLKNISIEYQDEFRLAKETSEFLAKSLEETVDLARAAQVFLGEGDLKRYLVVFQNNAELRATGGFIGSYALVDFSQGKIKNIEVPAGGSYDTEAGLKVNIVAPEPLHLVNPLWHFWDANWWPDWPTSAKKLMWFYENSGGPTVDGVISLTPTVLERLLNVIGPIDMTEKYGVVINADNFWETTRSIIEVSNENFKTLKDSASTTEEVKPKAIIGDLAAEIIKELPERLDRKTLIKLVKSFEASLNEKHILFYFTDDILQEKIEKYGWDGKIKHTAWDFLSVVNTNIAGGKSDRRIKEIISHKAQIFNDGSIIDTVVIKRTHTGLTLTDSSGVRNVNWMRIYVPLGSKLLEASGFRKPNKIYFEKPEEEWKEDFDVLSNEGTYRIHEESGTKIYEESGKTVFANWSMVDPGQTVEIYLKYQLPFKLQEKNAYTVIEKIRESLNPAQKNLHTYALLVQKQSGSIPSEINSKLILPESMNIIWFYPNKLNIVKNGWTVGDRLDIDKFWAVVIEK